MFVREKSARGHTYLYLVDNKREGGRIRQRIIRALGRKDVRLASGELDRLAASLVTAAPARSRQLATAVRCRAILPGLNTIARVAVEGPALPLRTCRSSSASARTQALTEHNAHCEEYPGPMRLCARVPPSSVP